MKRWTSLLLSLFLLGSLGAPAMAAGESADERLARVTERVKSTLALDTDAYTDFRGEVSEQPLGTVWSLYWSGENASLNVEALEDGTIISYWRDDNEDSASFYGRNLPVFPKIDEAAAKKAAADFLGRVLDASAESVALENEDTFRLSSTVCSFGGAILLHGLRSPMSYSITVRGSDNTVTSFHRDAPALSFLGAIPSPTPTITKDAAARTLRETLKLELIYVTDGDAAKAMLRYVPRDNGSAYCVDAQTGKLVAPDGGYSLYGGDSATETEMAMDNGAPMLARGLTEVELAGVERMEGVLSSEALDQNIRGESAYRLDGYRVSSADYRLVKNGDSEDTVLCTLCYAKADDENGANRVFTVDARTGAVKSLWSGGVWNRERTPSVSAVDAQKTAEAFLGRYSAHADEFALYSADDQTVDGAPYYGFTFARKVNGYFFPENSASVQIDCMSGAVCGLNYTYGEDVAFDGAEGVVSADAALDAWAASYDTVLAYRMQGKELDAANAAEKRLLDSGVTRFRTLLLSYAFERDFWSPGVDAKTGKLVQTERADNSIAYGDIAECWAKAEIERLAKYGIGYAGGTFDANKALTQWDLVCLLASVRGWALDPASATAEERDGAYLTAYRMGALTRGERDDNAVLTRGALVRMLIGSAGYGAVAKLPGIFTCSFSDRADIPAAELGYAALAQGFGLVKGAYAANETATRAVAAVMLCRLMEREA